MRACFLLAGLLLLTNVQADELYRYIDSSGQVQYSDRPPAGSRDFEELKAPKPPVPEARLSYETQRAMRNFPVTLYTFPDCGSACQMARDLLNKRGIPFTEKSLTRQEDIDAFRKASGDSRMPAISIGTHWLTGFQAEDWNKELDFAGYPKAPLVYRPRLPAAPLAPQPAASAPQAEPAAQPEQ